MATANVVSGSTQWIAKGRLKTNWNSLTITTTGDVGSVEQANPGLSVLSVYVTGTVASDTVVQFQESSAASLTFGVCQTVCGTDLQIDSTTGTGLSTGVVYLVRPGATHFRPKITAGASGTEDVSVVFIQSET